MSTRQREWWEDVGAGLAIAALAFAVLVTLTLLSGCAVQFQAAGSVGRGQTKGTVDAEGNITGDTVATVRGVEMLQALPPEFWSLMQGLRTPALTRGQWLALAAENEEARRSLQADAERFDMQCQCLAPARGERMEGPDENP